MKTMQKSLRVILFAIIVLIGIVGLQVYFQVRTLNTLEDSFIVDKPTPEQSKADSQAKVRLVVRHQVRLIVRRYKVDHDLAHEVVLYAHKYQRKDFPRAEDILALVGIESSFNPDATSSLEEDPAIGLTQIRPGAWSKTIDPEELNEIKYQIKHGANILAQYYKDLGNASAAIQAYNVGLYAYKQGHMSSAYYKKYTRERVVYAMAL